MRILMTANTSRSANRSMPSLAEHEVDLEDVGIGNLPVPGMHLHEDL